MKIYFYLTLMAIMVAGSANAAYITTTATEPVPDYLKVENFVKMTPREFSRQSGHQLGFFQKMYFRKLKRALLKTNYNEQTTLLSYYNKDKGKFKLDTLWFILGIMIGPFAVLFSYTIKDKSKNKKISAWLGLPIFVLWFGLMFLF